MARSHFLSVEGRYKLIAFLRENLPRNWAELSDSVTDNFRVINPKDSRVVT
jgi:hypothetical protein